MRKNYHREALSVFEHPEAMDKDAMLWWISKAHPSVFVWAARATTKKDFSGEVVDHQVLDHIKAGNLLNAIKRYREITPGMGLVNAKDYCDNLRASLGL